MLRPLLLSLTVLAVGGCAITPWDVRQNVILPEQRSIDYHDPAGLPSVAIPNNVPPRTVTDTERDSPDWLLSLDEAIRIALENTRAVRVLAGTTAVASGQTIYDPAISNTAIDQEQGRFDPVLRQDNRWSRTNTPFALLDALDPRRSFITSNPTDAYRSTLGLTKTNVLGGQTALTWTENPLRFQGRGPFPLNPQNPSAVELSYTQPLLQGGGYQVNTAPIVIARLNTEQSYFQYKDSVQEMVRGVIEAYWNLVQARIDVFARKIQVQQFLETKDREEARFALKIVDKSNLAQARTSYNQFRAILIAAKASVLTREGALRNILGLPPSDDRRIVPVSAPTAQQLKPDWDALVRLAEQRRPDIVELKLITEADRVRLMQAENQALPRVDAVALCRWNGLSGTMPNGEELETRPGQFTDWAVGVNFSVPLGLRTERARVRQQALLVSRDLANVEQGLHAAIHELASTVRDLDSAYDQYLAFKETRIAAADNVKVQNEKFLKGLGGAGDRTIYLTVLQALTDWGNAVTSEAQQLLNYNVALATLERRTGTILETHGLVFNEERFKAAGPLGILCQERLYPSALVPAGSPRRYPGTGEASENTFDLKNPAPRDEPKPPEKAPPPRRIPFRVQPLDARGEP